jgi:hypothetical protein
MAGRELRNLTFGLHRRVPVAHDTIVRIIDEPSLGFRPAQGTLLDWRDG